MTFINLPPKETPEFPQGIRFGTETNGEIVEVPKLTASESARVTQIASHLDTFPLSPELMSHRSEASRSMDPRAAHLGVEVVAPLVTQDLTLRH